MWSRLIAGLASALQEAGIPYLVVGGQAVLLYAEPRFTRDADILVHLPAAEALRVAAAAARHNLECPVPDPAKFADEHQVLPLIDRESGLHVQILFSTAPFEQSALARARKVQILNVPVCFAALNDLIIYKVVAGRERDREDLRGMLRKNYADVDPGHVLKWLALFEKETGEPFTAAFIKLCEELQIPCQSTR